MYDGKMIYALREEIGNPDLFSGRKRELDYFFKWCLGVKNELSQSTAILARRKRGKTALVQRLFNILYSLNDPQLIPFFFRTGEIDTPVVDFSSLFYRSLLTQYFAFKKRQPAWCQMEFTFDELIELAGDDQVVGNDIHRMRDLVADDQAVLSWEFARRCGHRLSALKDERIIQIIDEFQYMDKYIFRDQACRNQMKLCCNYHREAESKVSPQIITGSYIGWLTAIIRHMVSRYREFVLPPLPEEEVLEQVYNYSNILSRPVTEESAAAIASIAHNDPYYISQVIRSDYPRKDSTDPVSVEETMDYETNPKRGQIAKMWLEYIWDAFETVNDKNAKAIVLYLAKHGGAQRTREEILQDLKLDMTDGELEEKLHKLVKADIIADGETNFQYAGLGDPIFEIVFRKIYQMEIDRVDNETIRRDVHRIIDKLKRQVAHHKGMAGEYRVINKLVMASIAGTTLDAIVDQEIAPTPLGPFQHFQKRTFHLDQHEKIEVDAFLEHQDADGPHIVLEVKNWTEPVHQTAAEAFIATKKKLEASVPQNTIFLLYAENGLTPEAKQTLQNHGALTTTAKRLQ